MGVSKKADASRAVFLLAFATEVGVYLCHESLEFLDIKENVYAHECWGKYPTTELFE